MKMWHLKYSTTFICAVFIAIGAASGEEVKYGAVGGTVSFGPTSITPPVSSIIWKHKSSSGVVVKAIEWDVDDGESIPNSRFKGITTLAKETGNITISKLSDEHSGLYTIDINSKEQEQRFKLEIMPPVPKPDMKIEKIQINPNAVYLICEYSETIIWRNSAGGTPKGSPHSPKGEVIKVEKTGNPDVFYTCTLKNEVSKETSEPVYEKDLFEESGPWWIVLIVLLVPILLLAAFFVLYKFCRPFHDFVYKKFGEKACIGGILNHLDGTKNPLNTPSDDENVKGHVYVKTEIDPLNSPSDDENVEDNDYVNAQTGGDKQEGAENSNGPGIKEDSTLSESGQ